MRLMANEDPRSIHALRKRWQTEHFPSSDRVRRQDSSRQSNRALEDLGQERDLTEVDAPSPLREERPYGRLEDRHSSSRSKSKRSRSYGGSDSLNEVAAPPPVDDEDEEDRRLSDEEHGFHSSGERQSLEEERQFEKDESSQQAPKPSQKATELYMISWLIFFSFWGTLARVGLEAITLYPNTPFPSRVLWANLGGSFCMGFLTEDRRLFWQEWGTPSSNDEEKKNNHGKVKKTVPLFVGLATGFCGCFTSFSSFMRDAVLALSNDLSPASPIKPYETDSARHSRNGGFSFLAVLAVLIIEPAVSICALKTGAHFALLTQPITPTLPYRFGRHFLDPLGVVLAFGCWLGAIFLAIWPPGNTTDWRSRAVFPLIFAPIGCLGRFYVSKYLNARIPSFPLGTFVVNVLGTCILGMAYDLQHANGLGASNATTCAVLAGVIEGTCGCLTTVSTWVLELDGLRRRHAWIYGLASVSVGLACMVIVMGSMQWTIGFNEPVCS